MKLTLKQEKFCIYFVQSGNATEAAIKAGYSKKSAYSVGSENLRKPEIQKKLEELSKPAKTSEIATANEVLEFFTSVMKNGEEATKNRIRAAENLAKRFGVDKEAHSSGERELDKLVGALNELCKPH